MHMHASSQAVQADHLPWHNVYTPVKGAPRSFFKALFFNTKLGAALATMSHAKVTPEGLKPQEGKRNMGQNRPPILYIPKRM